MKGLLRKIDLIILLVIATTSVVLSIIDFFDLGTVPQVEYPVVTLFLLSAIGLHLIVSHFTQEDFQDETKVLMQAISELTGDRKFRTFNDPSEMDEHLANRLRKAKDSVYDLTWQNENTTLDSRNRQVSYAYVEDGMRQASKRIIYREIFIFNNSRVKKLNKRLGENNVGYSCRYYPDDTATPRLSFLIIDDYEIFFFDSAANIPMCAFEDRNLCKVFKTYYDAIWKGATRLKEGDTLYEEEIEKVRQLYPIEE